MTQNSNWEQNPFSEYGANSEMSYNSQRPVQAPQPPSDIPQSAYFHGLPSSYDGPLPSPYSMYEPSRPLSLREAVRQLFGQYIKVITKPSVKTFFEEMGKASWDIVWVQLLSFALVLTLLGLLSSQLVPTHLLTTVSPTAVNRLTPAVLQSFQTLLFGISIGSIVLIPLRFFIGVGIQFLLAKAFNGQGTFLAQSYATTLYQLPLNAALSFIALPLVFIPSVAVLIIDLLSLAVFIYSIVLNIFSLMAVHRLSGGKATAAVLIPYAVALALVCALSAFLVLFFVSLIHTIH